MSSMKDRLRDLFGKPVKVKLIKEGVFEIIGFDLDAAKKDQGDQWYHKIISVETDYIKVSVFNSRTGRIIGQKAVDLGAGFYAINAICKIQDEIK